MQRSELKYYLKQAQRPASLMALAVGFLGVILFVIGLVMVIRYSRMLASLQRVQDTTPQTQTSQVVVGGDATISQDELLKLTSPRPTTSPDEADFPLSYTVVPGDSSWKIAERYYGRGELYPVIERANKLTSDAWLLPGQKLTIPTPPAQSATKGGQVTPDQAAEQVYIVQPGDSLWYLATKYIGPGTAWPTIYQRNKSVIGPNPRLIKPGMRLFLPAP